MGTIDSAIVARLDAYAGLTALIGTRIYPPPVPQNPTYPLVTYQEIDTLAPHAMGCTLAIRHARYQVDSWASTRKSAKAVAAQIEAALDNYAGTSDGVEIKNCFLDIGRESPYDPAEGEHRYIQEFLIEYVKP